MATTEVLLPQKGMGMTEAVILEWHKNEGDSVAAGEVLVEVEAEKANVEIEAPVSGVLSRILYEVDDQVEVGQVIAIITS